MKYQTATLIAAFFGLSTALPVSNTVTILKRMLRDREVPQEHSHNAVLTSVNTNLKYNNPQNIGDAVFGLLGDGAAAAGAGSVTNLECLQQTIADTAFTNAKDAGDIEGMTNAILYQALERNTAKVGLASVNCNETAVNPEIAAVGRHQDPASQGAAVINKASTLAAAQSIASIGGNATDAINAGTFAPGDLNDSTGAGNTCDDPNDPIGCILSQNLLQPDATEDEINAAVVQSGDAVSSGSPAVSRSESTAPTSTSGDNVQTFTGTLGGAAPPVTSSAGDRPFTVNGATFVNEAAPIERSCAVQNNACANAVNSGQISHESVADCNAQEAQCNATASKTKKF